MVTAHNDNAKVYTLAKIEELISLLRWYKEVLSKVDPQLSDKDRRALMFAVARCVDVAHHNMASRAGINAPTGVLLAISQHFGNA